MQRRALLRSAAALPVAPAAAAGPSSGIVWSNRSGAPGSNRLVDVVVRPGQWVAGCGTESDGPSPYLGVADLRRGRTLEHYAGSRTERPETRADAVLDGGQRLLLVGVADTTPTLTAFENPRSGLQPAWGRSYEGTAAGPVRAAAHGERLVLGWTRAGEPGGVAVRGTDEAGRARWRDRLDGDRRLTGLLADHEDAAVVVGRRPDGSAWTTAWDADGNRLRDRDLETPGGGPAAVVADGNGLLLAGTDDDACWLQRRGPDLPVEWTRRYAGFGSGPGVADVAVRRDGYGLLAVDDEGTVVVRTGQDGRRRWTVRYAPYADPGERPARGHALAPAPDDEFLVAGSVPGYDDRDRWLARVGEPDGTTPVDTPVPGHTRTPECCLTRTGPLSGTLPWLVVGGAGLLAAVAGLAVAGLALGLRTPVDDEDG